MAPVDQKQMKQPRGRSIRRDARAQTDIPSLANRVLSKRQAMGERVPRPGRIAKQAPRWGANDYPACGAPALRREATVHQNKTTDTRSASEAMPTIGSAAWRPEWSATSPSSMAGRESW
jgi:hypothetical protein